MRTLLVMALLGLWAAPGRAEPAPGDCDPQDPKKCATGLLEGQKAPFGGQLLTPKLAVDLGLKADRCDERLKLELSRVTGLAAVQKELDLKLLTIERDTEKAKVEALQKALKKTEDLVPKPPWYEHPAFVATVTVVATVAVLFLSVKAVQLAGQPVQ